MRALRSLTRPFSVFVLLAVTGSAASLQALPWNNYSFRVFGGGFPSLPPAFDQSGVMVTIGDGTLPADSIYLINVLYKAGDEVRVAETHVKIRDASATIIVVLGKHDSDFKVLKVTITPHVPSGPSTEKEASS